MKNGLDIVNRVFASDDEIELLTLFDEDQDVFFGEIILRASPKKDLRIKVNIPKSYPLSDEEISVKFFVEDHIEASHLNLDQSICIHTPEHHDFEKRLIAEVKILKEWRNKYYLSSEIDSHYDYLLTPISLNDQSCFLFTDVDHSFKKDDYGSFKYRFFADYSIPKKLLAQQVFITEIGGHKCHWSSDIVNNPTSEGLFIFIRDEPIIRANRIVKDWIDFENYLPQNFLTLLYNAKSNKNLPEIFHLLIGYNIPKSKETHWQLIRILRKQIPIVGRKIAPKSYESACIPEEIKWVKTVNSSYTRFFGRGGLTNKLTRKKILILGVGAIGSGLSNILVRGGIRYLDFSDMDIVEPGNICRSEFYLTDSQLPKCFSLKNHLNQISPFIEIEVIERISKRRDGTIYEDTKQRLAKYDLIIDCTSDNELSLFLDGMNLNNIWNISISNEAKEMVFIAGASITSQKKVIFDGFQKSDAKLIYEGTGCWSPTFRASYFDIQSQLNLLVQNINHQLESFDKARTMMIKREINDNKITLNTIDY